MSDELLIMLYNFGPLALMILVFYFFFIKPQKKRENDVQNMRDSLEVGDYVTTIGGLIGKVVAVREKQVTIESGADRVKLHFAKWAVQGKTDAPSD